MPNTTVIRTLQSKLQVGQEKGLMTSVQARKLRPRNSTKPVTTATFQSRTTRPLRRGGLPRVSSPKTGDPSGSNRKRARQGLDMDMETDVNLNKNKTLRMDTSTEGHDLIDWGTDSADVILCKVTEAARCGPQEGIQDQLLGIPCILRAAHPENMMVDGLPPVGCGKPKTILARRNGAVCIATVDGSIWLTHLLQMPDSVTGATFVEKTAEDVLGQSLEGVPHLPVSITTSGYETFQDVWVKLEGAVAIVHFHLHAGAVGVSAARRMTDAIRWAKLQEGVRVVVLAGGDTFFANGMDTNAIEGSEDQHIATRDNATAVANLLCELMETDSHVTMAALRGDVGAAGLAIALATDVIAAPLGVVIDPFEMSSHLGLPKIHFLEHLLRRRAGKVFTDKFLKEKMPLLSEKAFTCELVDHILVSKNGFMHCVTQMAHKMADPEHFDQELMALASRRKGKDVNALQQLRVKEEKALHMLVEGDYHGYASKRRHRIYAATDMQQSKPQSS